MSNLVIFKRDGAIEKWSDDKIVNSIGKAGVSIKDAESISSDVEKWSLNNSENSKISSTKIRNRVIEELQRLDPLAAESYRTFKK